ncbi:MAG: thioredoxin family protein [Planctomycetes bacterium]|nr:thioredoxin family protein [Planctomycetota bacterium]
MPTRLILAFALALTCLTPAFAADRWQTDLQKALREAKKRRVPLVLDFTGSDWCGYCIQLKKDVFDTKEFARWSKRGPVLLELDFPRRKKLPKKLAAQNLSLAKTYK